MSRFEDHMNTINQSHKIASTKEVNPGLLSKLAAELEGGSAPKAEGEVTPADSSIANAAPAVVSATEAVAVPQVTAAGGDFAEAVEGEKTPAIKPNEGVVISAGDGDITDANNFSKIPEAVAEATKESSLKEAEEIGKAMARSYTKELQKIAIDDQYEDAVSLLKEAGLLDAYDIKTPEISKEASLSNSALEKIAAKQSLTKEDMVNAAHEVIAFSKEAEDAEASGRSAARDLVASLEKKAEEAIPATEPTPAATPAATPEVAPAAAPEAEKTSADNEIVKALSVLREKGLLN